MGLFVDYLQCTVLLLDRGWSGTPIGGVMGNNGPSHLADQANTKYIY